MRDKYKKQVALLIRIMPSVYRIKEFAVHGGTAINLFHKNLPRYSVDIDLTYIPIQDRTTSLCTINERLLEVKRNVERTIPGIVVVPKPNIWKLLCTLGDATVKIESEWYENEVSLVILWICHCVPKPRMSSIWAVRSNSLFHPIIWRKNHCSFE